MHQCHQQWECPPHNFLYNFIILWETLSSQLTDISALLLAHYLQVTFLSKGSDHAHFHLTPQPLYIVGLATTSYAYSIYNVARQHTSCLLQSTSQYNLQYSVVTCNCIVQLWNTMGHHCSGTFLNTCSYCCHHCLVIHMHCHSQSNLWKQ